MMRKNEVLQRFKSFVVEEYTKLCIEFGIDDNEVITFGVFTPSEIVKFLTEHYLREGDTLETHIKRICSVLDSVREGNSTFTIPVEKYTKFYTGISEQALMSHIVACNDNYDMLEEKLRFDLRHEIGHVLFMRRLFSENKFEKANSMFNSMTESLNYIWNGYKKDNNIDAHKYDKEFLTEMYTTYHTMPVEREANREAKIDLREYVDTLIKFDLINAEE